MLFVFDVAEFLSISFDNVLLEWVQKGLVFVWRHCLRQVFINLQYLLSQNVISGRYSLFIALRVSWLLLYNSLVYFALHTNLWVIFSSQSLLPVNIFGIWLHTVVACLQSESCTQIGSKLLIALRIYKPAFCFLERVWKVHGWRRSIFLDASRRVEAVRWRSSSKDLWNALGLFSDSNCQYAVVNINFFLAAAAVLTVDYRWRLDCLGNHMHVYVAFGRRDGWLVIQKLLLEIL